MAFSLLSLGTAVMLLIDSGSSKHFELLANFSRIPSKNSPDAFFVKVRATMFSGFTPSFIKLMNLSVSLKVLPVPAEAGMTSLINVTGGFIFISAEFRWDQSLNHSHQKLFPSNYHI